MVSDHTMAEIEELLAENRPDEALSLAQESIKRAGESAELLELVGSARWELGDVRGAAEAFTRVLALAPDDLEAMVALAQIRFALLEFDEAKRLAQEALEKGEDPAALYLLSYVADREGDYASAEGLARAAHESDPEDYPLPHHMGEEEFQECAERALARLPQRFREAMRDQLTLIIEPHPPIEILQDEDPPIDPTILGLYTGVPLPEREPSLMSGVLPDHIHLFQRNIERAATDRDSLINEITTTLYHEIGHFLGLEEEDMEELELD